MIGDKAMCPVCGGTGIVYVGEGFSPCWTCEGSGVIPKQEKEEEKDGD